MPSRTRQSREQLDLLTQIPEPPTLSAGSLACSPELRGLLADALKRCAFSRHQVAARMSELTGDDITIHQLNAWTAETREPWRFPVEYAPAFEVATSTHSIIEFLARKRGCRVVIGREVLTAELGAIEAQKTELKGRERTVRKLLEIHRAQ